MRVYRRIIVIICLFALFVTACTPYGYETKLSTQNNTETPAPSKEATKPKPINSEKPIQKIPQSRFEGIPYDSKQGVSNYIGLEGYISPYLTPDGNAQSKFPEKPWGVKTFTQVGPSSFEETKITIPHKTKVKVIDQYLWNKGWNMYDGALLVETLEGEKKQYYISHYDFVLFPYWEKTSEEAIKIGPFIATYNGDGEKPLDSDAKWVDIPIGTRVIADKTDLRNGQGKIRSYVYKQWRGGYGGGAIYFDPVSLKVEY